MESKYGFNWIDRKDILIVLLLLAISIPTSIFATSLLDFRNYYLSLPLTPYGILKRAFGMFLTEIFFRGFLLFSLSKRFGKWSILLQDIPYIIIHIGKPLLEIPFSGIAGLVFGKINYRSKSFLPSFLLHAIGSELFILMVHLI